MNEKILTNARIEQFCGEKAKYIIQVVSEFIMAYPIQHGTIEGEYSKDGEENVRKLLDGVYIGDGSKIWFDSVFFVHYDGKEGRVNLGKVRGVRK